MSARAGRLGARRAFRLLIHASHVSQARFPGRAPQVRSARARMMGGGGGRPQYPLFGAPLSAQTLDSRSTTSSRLPCSHADCGRRATQSLFPSLRITKAERRSSAPHGGVGDAPRRAALRRWKKIDREMPKPFSVHHDRRVNCRVSGKTLDRNSASVFRRRASAVLLAAGDTFRAAAREHSSLGRTQPVPLLIAQEPATPGRRCVRRADRGARAASIRTSPTRGAAADLSCSMEESRERRRKLMRVRRRRQAARRPRSAVLAANSVQHTLAQVEGLRHALGLTGLILTKRTAPQKAGWSAPSRLGVRFLCLHRCREGLDDLLPFVRAISRRLCLVSFSAVAKRSLDTYGASYCHLRA